MRNGQKHGKGILFRKDGSHYEGSWFCGMEHGQGTTTWPDREKSRTEEAGGSYVGEFYTGIFFLFILIGNLPYVGYVDTTSKANI